MRDFELVAPHTRAEVIRLLGEGSDESRIIAGGTGLMNLIKQRLASPQVLISLHRVTDLGGIHWTTDTLTLGATERLLDVELDPETASRLPILNEVLGEVGSPRIRSMATIGGALAHGDPNQDLPVVLMALDASVTLEDSSHQQVVGIDSFFRDYYETALEPGQLLTAVTLAVPDANSRFHYKKFTPGSREDYACVGVCIRLDLASDGTCEDSRIVLGSVGPTVFRARSAEALLRGQKIDQALAARAATAAAGETDPMDDTRGSAGYKRRMAEVWVRRSIMAAVSG